MGISYVLVQFLVETIANIFSYQNIFSRENIFQIENLICNLHFKQFQVKERVKYSIYAIGLSILKVPYQLFWESLVWLLLPE